MSSGRWIEDLPVVDIHCHLFDLTVQEHAPEKRMSLSLHEMPREDLASSMVYLRLINELASWLGTSPEQAWETRMARARSDYRAYVRDLLGRIPFDAMVVDTGYKPAEVNVGDFRSLVPCRVDFIFRLESVLDRLWQERVPLADAEAQVAAAIDADDRSHGIIGLKTIIGYRTGLAIRNVDRRDAQDALSSGDEKTYRDYFFLFLLDQCRRRGLPLQVHSGFGESNIYLERANPLFLKPLLDSGRADGVKILLLHAGFPYAFETGYLVAAFPNLYAEFSEVTPFAWLETDRALRSLLAMAPTRKIMFGSDGFILPESHWLGARIGKARLGALLDGLVGEGALTAAQAEQVAVDILAHNGRRFYGMNA